MFSSSLNSRLACKTYLTTSMYPSEATHLTEVNKKRAGGPIHSVVCVAGIRAPHIFHPLKRQEPGKNISERPVLVTPPISWQRERTRAWLKRRPKLSHLAVVGMTDTAPARPADTRTLGLGLRRCAQRRGHGHISERSPGEAKARRVLS